MDVTSLSRYRESTEKPERAKKKFRKGPKSTLCIAPSFLTWLLCLLSGHTQIRDRLGFCLSVPRNFSVHYPRSDVKITFQAFSRPCCLSGVTFNHPSILRAFFLPQTQPSGSQQQLPVPWFEPEFPLFLFMNNV